MFFINIIMVPNAQLVQQPVAMHDKMVMCTELELEDAFRNYRL